MQPGCPCRGTGQRGRLLSAIVGFGEQAIDETEKVPSIRWQRVAFVGQIGRDVIEDGDTVLVLGEQAEIGAQPEMAAMLAEDVHSERMEGAQVGTVRPLTEKPFDPLSHFGGGLVGKGQREHRCIIVFLEYPGDPKGQHPGLARARPCQHEKRAVVPRHGLVLVLVEGFDNERHHAPCASNTTSSSTARISAVIPSAPRSSISIATAAAARVLDLLGRCLAYSFQ